MTANDPQIQAVQERSRRFASLRAAQRALSDLAHPGELETSLAQGSELLRRLQALSPSGASRKSPESAADELQEIDLLLDALSAAIRAIVDDQPINQLISLFQHYTTTHPEEIRGVIDALLEGDLAAWKNLRLIEFLVTSLCCEEDDHHRRVVREPREVAPGLVAVTGRLWGEADLECQEARKNLLRAASSVLSADAVGPTRDRIRDLKTELGTRILHPDVLSAAVQYNVAMANRVTGMVEGAASLDRLAEDLLELPGAAPAESSSSIFDSEGFARLVAGLRQRLEASEEAADAPESEDPAARVVACFDFGALTPSECDAMGEPAQTGEPAFLIQYALTLSLARRALDTAGDALGDLGIEPDLLVSQWPLEVAREVTVLAQNLVSERRYVEASRLSELKGRHLKSTSAFSEARRAKRAAPDHDFRAVDLSSGGSGGLNPSVAGLLGLGIAVVLVVCALATVFSDGPDTYGAEALAQLSPYLHDANRSHGDVPRFVGTVNVDWDGLSPEARLEETEKIGTSLAAQGVKNVLLLDRFGRVQAQFLGGRVVHQLPEAEWDQYSWLQ